MTQFIEQAVGFFISDAAAQAAGSAGEQSALTGLLPMVALFVIFYFLLIRPQQKRQKEHKNMVANLAKGDEVVTTGGVLGKINKIGDNFVDLEIANNVEIKIQKNSVSAVMPKGTIKAS